MPPAYIAAVEQGVAAAMQTGVLAGHPMVGIRVTLLDASYHKVDSSERAFNIAASIAFKEAALRAQPITLEPAMSVEFVVPVARRRSSDHPRSRRR